MSRPQSGILAPIPRLGRYLFFNPTTDEDLIEAFSLIQDCAADDELVLGIGYPLAVIGGGIEGLRVFPSMGGPGVGVPSTQAALWCWLREESDRGELVHRTSELEAAFEPILELDQIVDSFKHGGHDGGLGHDLTGYEDGTENPKGQDAVDAAIVSDAGEGLDGSSFVAVQKWTHDLEGFASLDDEEADHVIGRSRSDNRELEEAPESAHVKRTDQESFEPDAFVLRQSMPWADSDGEGLMFVAFGETLDAYEAQLTRMVGLEDGIVDGLFRFSRPVSGGYYWCPPTQDGQFDLTALDF